MKRKRLKKLLMADSVPRDVAEVLSQFWRGRARCLLAAETREEINRKGAGRPFEHAYRVYIHKGGGI